MHTTGVTFTGQYPEKALQKKQGRRNPRNLTRIVQIVFFFFWLELFGSWATESDLHNLSEVASLNLAIECFFFALLID